METLAVDRKVKHKKTIVLIVCYFGTWPEWFQIFIRSCQLNPTINFIFFTDCLINEQTQCSPNIEFHDFSLKEFNMVASHALGFPVEITNNYKLCDFKPAYGVIFKDHIKDFDFWGYTDIDVIFGDIRGFIDDSLLTKYDVITAKKQYLLGHFTIYKNSSSNNSLFKESKDFERVFRNANQLFCFDECNFLWFALLDGKHLSTIDSDIESMTHVVRALEERGLLKAYFKTIVIEQDKLNGNNQFVEFDDSLIWVNGKLFSLRERREFMYFHFHFLKKKNDFEIPDWDVVPDEFMISRKGFISIDR
jgi:hypothetical protein